MEEFNQQFLPASEKYVTMEEVRALIANSMTGITSPLTVKSSYMQSDVFVSGSNGWRFDSLGNLEANTGYFRGDITGATGTFSGSITGGSLNIPDITTANSFHTDTTGNSYWGCNVASWTADHANAKAYVLNTGVAKFQDVFQVGESGKLLQWDNTDLTLQGGVITGGTIQTSATGRRVVIDGLTNSIKLTGDQDYFTVGSDFSNLVMLIKTAPTEEDKRAAWIVNQGTGPCVDFKNSNALNDYRVIGLEQLGTGCHIRANSLSANPETYGGDIIGDMAVVNGGLRICTTAGSPGTFKNVGNEFDGRYITDTGTTDTYAITVPYGVSSYEEGMSVKFKANTSNTKDLLVEDCEDNWDDLVGAYVVQAIDAFDYKQGTNSLKISIGKQVTSGSMIATNTISSKDLSGKGAFCFWIKCIEQDVPAGSLKIYLDNTAECASPLETFDVPALTTNTWRYCTFTLANPASDTAIISIGLYMVTQINAEADRIIQMDYFHCNSCLNVNGVGPVEIKRFNSFLTGGDIVADDYVNCIYDGSYWQMEKIHPPSLSFVASDSLKYSNDDARTMDGAAYQMEKEITLHEDLPAARVKYTITTTGASVWCKLYKNDIAIGTEYTTDGVKSQDFTDFKAGDRIQIYAKRSGAGSPTVSNFRLYFSKEVDSIEGHTLVTPLVTTDTFITSPTHGGC